MQKSIMKLAALLCSAMTVVMLTSCDDDKDKTPVKPTNGKAVITINPAAMYEELDLVEHMPHWLEKLMTIRDSVLIYDQAGDLVAKLGVESNTLQPLTIETDDLPNGTYTLVGWQTSHASNGQAYFISGEEKLSTVNLYTTFGGISYVWAVGSAAATVTIDGGSLEADISPKALGSILEIRVDSLTEEDGYKSVVLRGPNDQFVVGCRLAPSLTEEDRWIMEREHNWADFGGRIKLGTTSDKFFIMSHGNLFYNLYGEKEDDSKEWIADGSLDLPIGDNGIFYFDMSRRYWQPSYFGNLDGFAAWKADRDDGILVFDPCVSWGCSIDDVIQHVKTKQWWADGNGKLEFDESNGFWVTWYFVANKMRELYLFDSEDGKSLRGLYVICSAPEAPVEMVHHTLLKQHYDYKGKVAFPNLPIRDIYFSADGKTEVQIILVAGGKWQIYYQPTDPDDFQYIIPDEEAAAHIVGKHTPAFGTEEFFAAPRQVLHNLEEPSPKTIDD